MVSKLSATNKEGFNEVLKANSMLASSIDLLPEDEKLILFGMIRDQLKNHFKDRSPVSNETMIIEPFDVQFENGVPVGIQQ